MSQGPHTSRGHVPRHTNTSNDTDDATRILYAVLTIMLAPISYGPMQVRVSEAMTVLPALTSAGIPGLLVGCVFANLLGPYGLIDIICGSLEIGRAHV